MNTVRYDSKEKEDGIIWIRKEIVYINFKCSKELV